MSMSTGINSGGPNPMQPRRDSKVSKWQENMLRSQELEAARKTAEKPAERPDGIDPGAYATLKGMKPFVIVVAAFLGIYAIAHWIIGVV